MRDDKNRILGDRCAVCPRCGFARRYMLGHSEPGAETCPDCGTALLVACPSCGETIASVMQVDCRACGTPLRPAELFGAPIRRKPEPTNSSTSSASPTSRSNPSPRSARPGRTPF